MLVLYATGGGLMDYPLEDGQAAPLSPLARPQTKLAISFAGMPATIEYAGIAPLFINGLLQINVRVPPVASGAMALGILPSPYDPAEPRVWIE